MHYAEEKFTDIQAEYKKLVYGYWYATPENEGHIAVDYDWHQYEILDNIDMLKLYTARDGWSELVGVALYVVVNALHHKGYKIADCDTLATGIAHRGRGVARSLLSFAVSELWALDVQEIIHSKRLVLGGEDTLFTQQGFRAIETRYSLKRAN